MHRTAWVIVWEHIWLSRFYKGNYVDTLFPNDGHCSLPPSQCAHKLYQGGGAKYTQEHLLCLSYWLWWSLSYCGGWLSITALTVTGCSVPLAVVDLYGVVWLARPSHPLPCTIHGFCREGLACPGYQGGCCTMHRSSWDPHLHTQF